MAARGETPSTSRTLTQEQCWDYELWWVAATDPTPDDVVAELLAILRRGCSAPPRGVR